MPVVSILMPCYNVHQTIDEAMSSLVSQTLTDFEVVAVDDGSTDGTLSQLQRWAQRDQRIRVMQLPHQGIINTLNKGLQACKSPFVARMDADDRSIPDRLTKQINILVEKPELVVVTSLVRGFPEGSLGIEFQGYMNWLNSLHTDEDIKREIFVKSPLAHPSVAYRRDWVEKVGGYQDYGWAEDYDLWVRLFLAGATFGKVDSVLLEWRDHPQRLTHTDGRYSASSDLRLKAHYLVYGPISSNKRVYLWGMGDLQKQLGKQLLRVGCSAVTYVNAHHIPGGSVDQGMPVISVEKFFKTLSKNQQVVVLVDEKNEDIEKMLCYQLMSLHLTPGIDWFKVA